MASPSHHGGVFTHTAMLASHVRNLQNLDDLRALFVALGYDGADRPLADDACVIAQWRGFEVIAVEHPHPRDAARGLARSADSRSGRYLAAALDPGRALVLTAPRLGREGVHRVLPIPVDAPSAAALEHLRAFAPPPKGSALSHTLRVSELFEVESVGERFYRAFRALFDEMAAVAPSRVPAADRRMLTLLPLIRVLFLYFVQAKGWLDRRPDYLTTQLDRALQRQQSFHRRVLDPLCFHTLNRPVGQRRTATRFGRIPYLNGGLFDPHPAERRHPVVLPNALWRDAFDRVFERFRFCVREAHEVDAIAPDMLGRVFERLMDGDTRHVRGTFYTPITVVQSMVRHTLRVVLTAGPDLPADVATALTEGRPIDPGHHAVVRKRLRTLRVLDPAVGSGAFLVEMLETLATMREQVRSGVGPQAPTRLRRQIVQRNLFGVDIDPMGVRLAELRLWLAIIAPDPTVDIEAVAPLPNLDGVVRQGDSLLDPLTAAAAAGVGAVHWRSVDTASLATARRHVAIGRGRARRTAWRRLRQAERGVAVALLEQGLQQVEHRLAEYRETVRHPTLFGEPTPVSPEQRQAARRWREHRTALRRGLREARDGAVTFFAFEVHAGDVMRRGGFDVVIGNPPWVRAERLPPALRATLKERYTWWRVAGTPGFTHQPDLAVAFLQRACEVTRPGGTVAFLLPSKLTTAAYGASARRGLVRETTLQYLHRTPTRDANAFGATTYPLAVVATKAAPPPGHRIRLGFGGTDAVAQAALPEDGPWILVPDPVRDALEAFRHSGRPLVHVAPPHLGVKTGADRVLVGVIDRPDQRPGTVRFAAGAVELEPDVLRPAVRGRDLRPFGARATRSVVWAYDRFGRRHDRLPPRATAYLATHRVALARRTDARGGPPWTLFRLVGALAPHPVVWPDITRRPRAVALNESSAAGAVPLNTCYVSGAPDADTALATAAVLNSSFAAALLMTSADEARGRYYRMNARIAGRLPVPTESDQRHRLANRARTWHATDRYDQSDLDDAVASALALPPAVADRLREFVAARD